MAKKAVTLSDRLQKAGEKQVSFTRELILSLTAELIKELVEDLKTNLTNEQSLGVKFVKAVEGIWGNVLLVDDQGTVGEDVTCAEIIQKTQQGKSTTTNGILTTGRRASAKTWVLKSHEAVVKKSKVTIMDPFTHEEAVLDNGEFIGKNQDAVIAKEDGTLVMSPMVYMIIYNAMDTGEMNPTAATMISAMLVAGTPVESIVRQMFPQAYQRTQIQKNEQGDEWETWVRKVYREKAGSKEKKSRANAIADFQAPVVHNQSPAIQEVVRLLKERGRVRVVIFERELWVEEEPIGGGRMGLAIYPTNRGLEPICLVETEQALLQEGVGKLYPGVTTAQFLQVLKTALRA